MYIRHNPTGSQNENKAIRESFEAITRPGASLPASGFEATDRGFSKTCGFESTHV